MPQSPWHRSPSICVPIPVPSLTQSSRPEPSWEAVKKSLPPTASIFWGIDEAGATTLVLMSRVSEAVWPQVDGARRTAPARAKSRFRTADAVVLFIAGSS